MHLLTHLYKVSGTVLLASQKDIKNQAEWPFLSVIFRIDVNRNQVELCRRTLDVCLINAVSLSTWVVYKSLEAEQSAVLEIYAGAQNAYDRQKLLLKLNSHI